MSLLTCSVKHLSIKRRTVLMSSTNRALKPGGWIELQELKFQVQCDDGTVRKGNKVQDFYETMESALVHFDVDLLAMRHNKRNVTDAGFANVTEIPFKIPIGTWPKDPRLKMIGLYNRSMVHDALYGVAVRPFTHGLKWTVEELEVYLVDVRKELADSSQHGYMPFQIVLGQKQR